MDQALAALHQANDRLLPIALEFRRQNGEVTLACRFPEELRAIIEGQLYAQYPDCRIVAAAEANPADGLRTWTLDLHLHRELFPIRRYAQFEDALNRVSADPLPLWIGTARELPPVPAAVAAPAGRKARRRRWRTNRSGCRMGTLRFSASSATAICPPACASSS